MYLLKCVNKLIKVFQLQLKSIKIQFPLKNIKQNLIVNNKPYNN